MADEIITRGKILKVRPGQLLPLKTRATERVVYSEDFDRETSVFRKLCLLPFIPIWYHFVYILGLENSLEAMINALNVYTGNSMTSYNHIFYFADMVWLLNLILLLCRKYLSKLKTTLYLWNPRNLFWFTFDILSIIPAELFVPEDLKAYVALNRSLKICYLLFLSHCVNLVLEPSILSRSFHLICQLLYLIVLVSLLFAILSIEVDRNPRKQNHSPIEIISIVADQITGKGFGHMTFQFYLNQFAMTLCTIIIAIGVILFCTAHVTYLFLTRTFTKQTFRYKFNSLKNQLKRKLMPEEFIDCLDNFFHAMWIYTNGNEQAMGGHRHFEYHLTEIFSIIPPTFVAEITVDMCTGLFRHSMLLRNLPIPFLRDLSLCVRYEVFVKDQLIYKLEEFRDKLIYIYFGVVEIISDEDLETPIMQLTTGTCLSEMGLFFPTKSKFLVRCASNCIFHILKREDFMNLVVQHKYIFNKIKKAVNKRLKEARDLHSIQMLCNTLANNKKKTTNMCWVLFTLHKMMAIAHPDAADLHITSILGMEHIINESTFRRHIFCPNYLTLYAVHEETQEFNDTLFVKSSFPYIFKPETGLVLFWDVFVSVFALIAGLVLPYLGFTCSEQHKSEFYSTVYFLTAIWTLDIVVQLRIALVCEEKLLRGLENIIIMKLTSLMFVIDIMAVLPLEIFSTILVLAPKYKHYIYMNRVLKLGRVIQLLLKWDNRYKSNSVLVRFFCAAVIMVYSAFMASCVFYYVGYLDTTSEESFHHIFFYTSQILSGVALWVPGYSEFEKYQLPNIMLFILLSLVHCLVYGILYSAFTSRQFNLLSVKHIIKKLMIAGRHIDLRYKEYIKNCVHDTIVLDNGLNLFKSRYMYNTLPTEWLGYLYEIHYQQYIIDLPVFQGIPSFVLQTIFQYGGYTRNYNSHEVLFHVGELTEDIFILISGHCQVICGVTLHSTLISGVHELNSVEVILIIPMRTTVITLTHCRILRIKYPVMRRIILNQQTQLNVRKPLSGMCDLRAKLLNIPVQYFNQDLLDNYKKEMRLDSCARFKRFDHRFLDIYTKSSLYRIRCLIMALSFCPEGKFICHWEIVRCVFAVISALFFSSVTLCFYKLPHPICMLKWVLDVMALIDMYIRMHVAYYNTHGILVTHPCRTIVHYLKNGFTIDLLGVLPLHLIVYKAQYIVMNGNKLLQLHRYLAFLRYKRTDCVTPLGILHILALVPLGLILINIAASILILNNCTLNMKTNRNGELNCIADNIFNSEIISKGLTAQLYGIYVVLSVISKVAIQGFTMNSENMIYFTLLSFIAFFWNALNGAVILQFYINDHIEVMQHNLHMAQLKSFLLSKKQPFCVPKKLYRLAKVYLKLAQKRDKKNIHKYSANFTSNLRRDILYDKFGNSLNYSCLDGSTDIEPFIRNLLMHSEYHILDKIGIIHRRNDICEYTMIVYHGIVYYYDDYDRMEDESETNLPNLSRRRVTLGPGSIIGNLCPLKYNRLKVTMTSAGIVELIYIKTCTFFEIMQHFPSSQDRFLHQKKKYDVHIPGVKVPDFGKFGEFQFKKHKKLNYAFFCLNMSSFVGAYLGSILYLWDIISVNLEFWKWAVCGFDCTFFASIIMVFFLPVTNNHGEIVSGLGIIKQFFRPTLFYVSLFACIPFYLIYVDVDDKLILYYVMAGLRSNVLLRLFLFVKIFNKSLLMSPPALFVIKFILSIVLFIFFMGAVLVLFSNVTASNLNISPDLLLLLNIPLKEKFRHVIKYFYILTNIFTNTSQPGYFPAGILYVAIFIVLMPLAMVFKTVLFCKVIAMIQIYKQLDWEYLSKKNRLLALMRMSDTSLMLFKRLDFYCISIWRSRKGYKIPKLYWELPKYLQEPICEEMFGKVFEGHMVFGQIHDDLKRQLYAKMKMDYFHHGDYIVYQGTIDHSLYFVLKGTVAKLKTHPDGYTTTLKIVTSGQSFELAQGILENVPHDYSYRALSECVILYLIKEEWEYLLTFFPGSNTIIMQILKTFFQVSSKEHID